MENVREDPRFHRYVKELLQWNRSVNLIGRKSEPDVWDVHIEDSLSLQPYLEELRPEVVVDIGSGGGLPAIPLAILNPHIQFILTDVVRKKISFLEWVISLLKLNAHVVDINRGFLFEEECMITSRAYSELENIIRWQKEHAPQAKDFVLLKGTLETTKEELSHTDITRYHLKERVRGCVLTFSL